MDFPVAMETTAHAEIELSMSRSHSSGGSHIKKKKSISKVTRYSLELCKANEEVRERRFFVFLW